MRYTELQISSEILDQPEFSGQPKKIFICSTPRSGSYFLCRHMINAGLGVPHEYFNPVVMRQMAPRLGLESNIRGLTWLAATRKDRLLFRRRRERSSELDFLRKYLKFLMTSRCQGGVFAAKVHFRDFRRTLDNSIGDGLLDNTLFIQLHREDILKQAVSEHFGQLTGQWGIDNSVTTTPAANPNFFDPVAIDRALTDLADQDRGWRIFFARRGVVPLAISYERLCQDPFPFLEAIARRVGFDPSQLRRAYGETDPPSVSDPALPSKDEVARHYLTEMARLRAVARQT